MINPILSFETASLTDQGMVRGQNEDTLFALDISPSEKILFGSIGIYLVADGMGGYHGGEIASKLAAHVVSSTLLDALKSASQKFSPAILLQKAIEKANKEIYTLALSRDDLRGMGTTVTIGLRVDNELYIGHVGDSRAYLVRNGRIKLLTEDHSLVASLLKHGMINPNEAKNHPDRGKIVRCLGVSSNVNIDTYYQVGMKDSLILKANDYLIFCSDGLTSSISDVEIMNCVINYRAAAMICKSLIDLANANGGTDNVSVIVVRTVPG